MNSSACRHYVTYSGVKLPLRLVNELAEADIANRNTFFRAWFDTQERMVLVQKMVYGEAELQHRYEYHNNGSLMLGGNHRGRWRVARDSLRRAGKTVDPRKS
jgi:hypothetical protein